MRNANQHPAVMVTSSKRTTVIQSFPNCAGPSHSCIFFLLDPRAATDVTVPGMFVHKSSFPSQLKVSDFFSRECGSDFYAVIGLAEKAALCSERL